MRCVKRNDKHFCSNAPCRERGLLELGTQTPKLRLIMWDAIEKRVCSPQNHTFITLGLVQNLDRARSRVFAIDDLSHARHDHIDDSRYILCRAQRCQ